MKTFRRQTLTKEGFEKFKSEQDELVLKRKDAVKNLSQARELGDLSENGFYKAAKSELRRIDSRLNFLSYLLKTAQVIEHKVSEFVTVGSKVKVLDGEKNHEFLIVGSYESNPSERKISEFSPIGKALIGRKVGDNIRIITPRGVTNYKIMEIE